MRHHNRLFFAVSFAFTLMAMTAGVPARAESIRLSEGRRKAVEVAAAKNGGNKEKAIKCENAVDRRAAGSASSTTAESAKKTASPAEKQPAAPASAPQEIVTDTDCDQRQIESVNLCDVTGTVCENCGDIVLASAVLPEYAEIPAVAGGGISPLFALAAVPIGLIPLFNGDDEISLAESDFPANPLVPAGNNGGDTNVTPISPAPPAEAVPAPEPLSLLLFGSGLAAVGAYLRRRRDEPSWCGRHRSAESEGN